MFALLDELQIPHLLPKDLAAIFKEQYYVVKHIELIEDVSLWII